MPSGLSRIALLVVVGCSAPSVQGPPAFSTAAPEVTKPAAPSRPIDEIDRGVFVTRSGEQIIYKETFTITKVGDHLLLRSKGAAIEEPEWTNTDGELEVDAEFKPVRAAYKNQTPAQEYTYRLAGSPPTLDVTRNDKRRPQHIVAAAPIDVYIGGPGVAPMTAMCRVRQDVVLKTIGEQDTAFEDYVLAYEGTAVGALRRVVVNIGVGEFELLCENDRLITVALPDVDLWTTREGREDEIAALKQAPRPAKKKWVYPVIETAPWKPYHTWIVDKQILVNRDARKRQTRLTAYDLATGGKLAHRDFDVDMGVMCEPLVGGHLVCEIDDGIIQVINARTLADELDVAALIRQLVPDSKLTDWTTISEGHIKIDDKRAVRVDIKKKTAAVIPLPATRSREPGFCARQLVDPVAVGKVAWKIDQSQAGATLLRRAGKKELPPVKLDLYYPTLFVCGPKSDRPVVISNNADKEEYVVGALTVAGARIWTSENLGGHISEMWQFGDTLIVPTDSQTRRLVAFNIKDGKIKWIAAGPLPKK